MAVLNIYKPLGWTPLRVLDHLRKQDPSLRNTPMTYAGRLDPMAEGVLLVLTDEDRLKKEEFMKLHKAYEATFLFGFSTDSYDALGLANQGSFVDQKTIATELQLLKGVHNLPFPPYSSYKVQGKPLHWWAHHQRLDEIFLPIKKMHVLHVSDISLKTCSAQNVLKNITDTISLVTGDFRQEACIDRWRSLLTNDEILITATLTLEVTSGTYIRSLAHALGEKLGCGALLLHLKRTAVGEYRIDSSLHLTETTSHEYL